MRRSDGRCRNLANVITFHGSVEAEEMYEQHSHPYHRVFGGLPDFESGGMKEYLDSMGGYLGGSLLFYHRNRVGYCFVYHFLQSVSCCCPTYNNYDVMLCFIGIFAIYFFKVVATF